MLTIFTSPRPFKAEFDSIQRNSILSWVASCPNCEIILLGDDEGTDKLAEELNLKHVPNIKKNEDGIILRNSVFLEAQKIAKNDLLCFINADILLTGNFLGTIKSINLSSFMLSARRWDLDINEKINFFNVDWHGPLKEKIKQKGRLHGFTAGDFFVFPKNIELNMPPFSIKHGGWDNWFVYHFKSLKIPIIDATEVITIIHQNHNGHHKKEVKKIWKSVEGKKELKLAGGFSSMLTLRDADLLLTKNGLKKPKLLRRCMAELSKTNLWRSLLSIKRKIQHSL